MAVDVERAKQVVFLVLVGERGTENYEGLFGFRRDGFAKFVWSIEDHDLWWLTERLRDPRYGQTVRSEIAGCMRGRELAAAGDPERMGRDLLLVLRPRVSDRPGGRSIADGVVTLACVTPSSAARKPRPRRASTAGRITNPRSEH